MGVAKHDKMSLIWCDVFVALMRWFSDRTFIQIIKKKKSIIFPESKLIFIPFYNKYGLCA